MRTVTYGGAVSLDGFLAGAGGSIDWLRGLTATRPKAVGRAAKSRRDEGLTPSNPSAKIILK
jgi:hypothetical protein